LKRKCFGKKRREKKKKKSCKGMCEENLKIENYNEGKKIIIITI